jgi:hypothetical protein
MHTISQPGNSSGTGSQFLTPVSKQMRDLSGVGFCDVFICAWLREAKKRINGRIFRIVRKKTNVSEREVRNSGCGEFSQSRSSDSSSKRRGKK